MAQLSGTEDELAAVRKETADVLSEKSALDGKIDEISQQLKQASLDQDEKAIGRAEKLVLLEDKKLVILVLADLRSKARTLDAQILQTNNQIAEINDKMAEEVDAVLAGRPVETMLRRLRHFDETRLARPPTSLLQAKPPYDPAASSPMVDRDATVVGAWYYLTLGRSLPKINARSEARDATNDGAASEGRSLRGACATPRSDVRTIGLLASSAGCGKTHVGMDVWYFKDKLNKEKFDRARTAAGVRDEEWASVKKSAKAMSVCCINFNGTSAWSEDDHEMVKYSPWYKKTYDGDKNDAVGGKSDVGTGDAADGKVGVDGGTGDAAGNQGGALRERRRVQGSEAPDKWAEAHLLPLYLRALWCMMYQASLPYPDLAALVKERIEGGYTSARTVLAEARRVLRVHNLAIVVDELTMAGESLGDRELSELYRHVICTWTNGGRAKVIFLSLSFDFIAEERRGGRQVEVARNGRVDEDVLLRTSGLRRQGSPWSITVFETLLPPTEDELYALLLPLCLRREVKDARSVKKSRIVDPALCARALAAVSGGHMRTFSYMRDRMERVVSVVPFWDLVQGASSDAGSITSVEALLENTVFFPALLVAGLVNCTVQGAARLQPVQRVPVPEGLCQTWDDSIRNFVLIGSASPSGDYVTPYLVPAFLLALARQWRVLTERSSGVVAPLIPCILAACSRFVAAARQPNPADGWEVACFWGEVLLSRLRCGAAAHLQGAAGVRGVRDYSQVSLLELYPSCSQLEAAPSQHPLLTDVLVDATVALENRYAELEHLKRMPLEEVLQLPKERLVREGFMMPENHPSFDMIRFFLVVEDGRQGVTARTDGVVAVCLSSKSTSSVTATLPLTAEVNKPRSLLAGTFGNDMWSRWCDHTVHVTVTNYRRPLSPTRYLAKGTGESTIVVSYDQLDDYYGGTLARFVKAAQAMHGTRV